MADTTHQSRDIMEAANRSLQAQRAGGTHRPAKSIGRGSADLKRKDMWTRVKRVLFAIGAIYLTAAVAGMIINGIGFTGVMLTVIATLVAIFVFGKYPKMKIPQRAELNRGNVRQLVGRTELWLEAQRPALPAPAVTLVDQIGLQLDELGRQLEGVDQAHPQAQEVRRLVGEHLPEMVDSYRRIPAQLRREQRAGSSPDEQLVDSLGKISGEIDSVTRQLAQGSLDNLAIKTRYLEYRYGGEGAEGGPA